MNSLILKLVAVLLITLSASVVAEEEQSCSERVVGIVGNFLKMHDVFWYRNSPNGGVVVASACKVSPQDKNIVLVSFAYDLFDGNHPEKESEKELIVAMVNTKTKRVVSSYQETIVEDALTGVSESSLKIDAGRYQLNKNTRAFGLRFNSSAHGANCADNYWGDELNLFVQKGKTLQKIMYMPMRFTHFIKGCPASMNPDDIKVKFAFLTVDVQKTSNNGYADLLLTAHINESGEEDLKPKPTDERCLLRYDGNGYIKDRKFKPWWMLESW